VAVALALFTLLPVGPGEALVPAPTGSQLVSTGVVGPTPAPPRDQTLYTSGTAFSPPTSFNPLQRSSYTGTVGLLYETLFLYDPLHSKFVPWLAESGSWAGPATYRIQLRPGVDWVDSKSGAVTGELTGADVAFTVRLAMSDSADPAHQDVASVHSVSAAGDHVTVRFSEPVGYAEWQRFLWHAPVLPEAVWSKLPAGQQARAPNLAPVATGPMTLYSTSASGACYRDNPHWWGKVALALSFKFTYLCDLVSGSSGTALAQLLGDKVDWSNELLRGVPDLAAPKATGYGIKTYYPSTPYMIPASTAWLQMDLARAPGDDLDFRKAVAYAVDPSAVAQGAYTGTVVVAAPAGLLPELGKWVDQKAAKQLGFYYSPSLAKKYLAKSRYEGQQISFLVPQGETELSDAANLLTGQLGKVGVHVKVDTVPLRQFSADLVSGNYGMAINPEVGISATPWDYFDTVYRLPVPSALAAGQNTERFSDPAAWALVERAGTTPPTDTAELTKFYDELQVDFLEQLPEIPLWYTGAWFQANTKVWQGYPSSTTPRDQFTPVMWRGWLGSSTTVFALAGLTRSASRS
jgi:peptide/nickel transport system substrate-binding protein